MRISTIALFICLCFASQAQVRTCYTMDNLATQIAAHPEVQTRMQAIENETEQIIASGILDKKNRQVVTLPVVVHVLHNGEAIGTGANISNAQILSQIEALNEDYRKRNSDSLPTNHPFYSQTADVAIEFCLANKDTNGNGSSGILRWNIGANSVSNTDMEDYVKPQTIWNSKKYLNIWVCNITASQSILGYAQFPGGLTNTDGVVILTTAFGYQGNVTAPYDNGRTCVHEVGHWLNLRHIWGDSYCGNDNVADTRPAQEANYGCPTFPHNANACTGSNSNGEMYMNYMDYVNDACMVMFTQGQRTRMLSTLLGDRSGVANSGICLSGVGITEASVDRNAISILPNPMHDVMEIHVPSNSGRYHISIVNTEGKMLMENYAMQINGLLQLNVNTLPTGLYFVHIKGGSIDAVRKVIKD
jgi:Pregnancy-associated plasma protein-A/Secretion system C-terminal sorting domain